MVQTVIENWLQTAWPFRLQTSRCRSSCLLGLGFDESSDSAILSTFTTSEYFSSAMLISLSFSAGKLCNQAHYSPSERLGTRRERTGFIDHNLKTDICTSQFSAQNRICRQQFEVCKANDKKQRSEFDDRIGIVHRICKSQFSAQTETEFVSNNLVHKTEFVSHNLVHKTEFVSHNLVYKTELVDNNLKFAYEMTMEFND